MNLTDAEVQGLEPKTSASETDVLPITPHLIKPIFNYGAGVTGFEPVTSAFKARGVASYTIPHRGAGYSARFESTQPRCKETSKKPWKQYLL